MKRSPDYACLVYGILKRPDPRICPAQNLGLARSGEYGYEAIQRDP